MCVVTANASGNLRDYLGHGEGSAIGLSVANSRSLYVVMLTIGFK
jgi:hypothetical protein